MIFTIFNEKLSVSVDSMGAQLRSVRGADGTEYLWQGDALYWADCSPVLFPYIARLYKNSYTYRGEAYNMSIHGFAAKCEFAAECVGVDSITLVLRESEDTLSQYPFRFELRITYRLSGSKLLVQNKVINKDTKLMPFAFGAHPGFNVPLDVGTSFEDYYLCFNEPCEPLRVGFTDELLISGEYHPYPLEDGRYIKLRHSLFDDDAIILRNMAKSVTLGCAKTNRSLTISFYGFDYFGIWHAPKTDAPYVCLEPWSSLPSRQEVVEELTEKADMLMLNAGEEFENQWSLSIREGK